MIFTNKDSGARCWGESLLSQEKQRKHQLTFLHSRCPRSLTLSISNMSPPTHCPSLLLPVHLSTHPSDSLLLPMVFLNNLTFSSCHLDVCSPFWLTFFLVLFSKCKQKDLDVYARAEPHHNWKQVFLVNNAVSGSCCDQIPHNNIALTDLEFTVQTRLAHCLPLAEC